MSVCFNRTCSPRRGITLLEVLISMFVALVGLSGLAALFWVGGVEMGEGAKADRALGVARAAHRTFRILGMHRPVQTFTYTGGGATVPQTIYAQSWWYGSITATNAYQTIDNSPSTGPPGNTSAPAVMPFQVGALPPTSLPPPPPQPTVMWGMYSQGYCIDPIGVLANANTTVTNPVPGFPAYDPNGSLIQYTNTTGTLGSGVNYSVQGAPLPFNGSPLPCLSRVTLRSYHGHAYTAGQAENVFRSQDDLLLNPPTGDYPPTQLFSFGSAAGVPSRRQFQGDYSWLATVVPAYRSIEISTNTAVTPNVTTVTPQGDNNAVIVSIVVFWKRIPLVSAPLGTTPPSERMAQVNLTPYLPDGTPGPTPTGAAGGEVQLQVPVTSVLPTDAQQVWLNLRAGQWIMLSQAPPQTTPPLTYAPGGALGGQVNASTFPVTDSPPFWARWYKVTATGPVAGPTAGGVTTGYFRNVTLSGPDWNPGSTASGGTLIPTFASIFDGVVAVYEKEMELEPSDGPWVPR
jgi:hypothetical protein